MTKLNRIKINLAGHDETNKWLIGQFVQYSCAVSKWCKNIIQINFKTLNTIADVLDVKDLFASNIVSSSNKIKNATTIIIIS